MKEKSKKWDDLNERRVVFQPLQGKRLKDQRFEEEKRGRGEGKFILTIS